MEAMHIAIVGGGPGGLMTAHALPKFLSSPHEIVIFEAGQRLGGKIITSQFASAPISYEAGAAELYDYSKIGPDPLRQLIESLGLPTSRMAGDTVVLGDCFFRSDDDIEREFGGGARDSLRAFVRNARTRMSPLDYYESDWQADRGGPLSRLSFRALLNRIPDENVRRYIEVAVHSDLATEPELTSGKYGLQNYLMNLPEYLRLYTIDGGIERLPQQLAKRITADVRLNQPVVRVERTADELYRVYSRVNGEIQFEDFDFVVVALPNNWIPHIEWGSSILGSAMRRHVKRYHYPAHYLRVSALFETPFWREHIADSYFMSDAFGGCCVYDESSRNHAGSHGVLGWLLAGEAAMTMSNFDDATLVSKVLDSLPRSLRFGRDQLIESRVHRWIGSVNGLPGGRKARETESRHVPEPLDHPWLFVVGDYLFDATLNGVLDSAELVAEWIGEEVAEFQQRKGSFEVNGGEGFLDVGSEATSVPESNGLVGSEPGAGEWPGDGEARPRLVRAAD